MEREKRRGRSQERSEECLRQCGTMCRQETAHTNSQPPQVAKVMALDPDLVEVWGQMYADLDKEVN